MIGFKQRILAAALVCLAALPADVLRAEEPARPKLVKIPFAMPRAMENTPLIYEGRPIALLNHRDDTKNNTDKYKASMYLYLVDLQTGERLGEFGHGHSFVTGLVEGKRLHVFASEGSDRDWFQSIYHFWTDDLKSWQRELAIERQGDEHLFNCSVCRDDDGYVMAYESNAPVQFCFRFARSRDLRHWEPVKDLTFTGQANEYSACPVIRYFEPFYYVIYLHAPRPGHKGWISYVARSRDLASWQLSPLNPILEAGPGEGVNNSDVDVFEYEGNSYLVYATGDQATWGAVRVAMYAGSLHELYEGWFPDGVDCETVNARRP